MEIALNISLIWETFFGASENPKFKSVTCTGQSTKLSGNLDCSSGQLFVFIDWFHHTRKIQFRDCSANIGPIVRKNSRDTRRRNGQALEGFHNLGSNAWCCVTAVEQEKPDNLVFQRHGLIDEMSLNSEITVHHLADPCATYKRHSHLSLHLCIESIKLFGILEFQITCQGLVRDLVHFGILFEAIRYSACQAFSQFEFGSFMNRVSKRCNNENKKISSSSSSSS